MHQCTKKQIPGCSYGIVHSSQKRKATQRSMSGGMDTNMVTSSYRGYYTAVKMNTPQLHTTMVDGSHNVTKEHVQCHSSSRNSKPGKTKLSC